MKNISHTLLMQGKSFFRLTSLDCHLGLYDDVDCCQNSFQNNQKKNSLMTRDSENQTRDGDPCLHKRRNNIISIPLLYMTILKNKWQNHSEQSFKQKNSLKE